MRRQAALYAVMSGHVARILPVCRGWEDTAWAFLRCWLDAMLDDRLRESAHSRPFVRS